MSKKISDLLNSLFTAIKISTEEFVLPTGKHLIPATIISFVILVTVTLFKFLNVYTIIDIPGAALGCLILCAICFIERRERSEKKEQRIAIYSRKSPFYRKGRKRRKPG